MDKHVDGDMAVIEQIYQQNLIERGGLSPKGVWRKVATALRVSDKEVYLRRAPKANDSKKGVEGAQKIADFFNKHASQTIKKELQKIETDPFYALEISRGKAISNTAFNLVRKYYFEGLDKFKENAPSENLARARVYTQKKLEEKLPADYQKIILTKQTKQGWFDGFMARLSNADRLVLKSHFKGKRGKFLQQDIDPEDISDRGTASHAKGVAAGETGQHAQAKHPRPAKDDLRVNPRGGRPPKNKR